MGDRGHNAGGWAYMPRVWCPLCGFSFLIGRRRFDAEADDRDPKRPTMKCTNPTNCRSRQKRKKG